MPADGDDLEGFVRRALAANGEVREAWFEWKSALEAVDGAAAWPDTRLALGASWTFSDDGRSAFDRFGLDLGVDTMENLSFPTKAKRSGERALAEAQAAGERFRAASARVRRETVEAWLDAALAAEEARLAAERRRLAALSSAAATAATTAGAGQAAALDARLDEARALDDEAAALARASAAGAALRAAAALCADASSCADIDRADDLLPSRLPSPRPLPLGKGALEEEFAAAPAIAALAKDLRAREREADLARLQWIPDVNPRAAITGSMEQAVGAMVMLPTTVVEIRSAIAATEAMREATKAALSQQALQSGAAFARSVVAAREAERARNLLEGDILATADAAARVTDASWRAGSAGLDAVVETRLLRNEIHAAIAAAAIERERSVADAEEILGVGDDASREKNTDSMENQR